MRTLIIAGHPHLYSGSLANLTIVNVLKAQLKDAQIISIADLYPTGGVNVQAEQERLAGFDTFVLQFPLFWYSLPGCLKNYLDSVFTHGFAHGSQAVLGGRNLIYSFTAGAGEDEYAHGRAMNHPIEDFLYPFKQTAALCRLNFYEVHTLGMMYVEGLSSEEDRKQVIAKAEDHARRLIKLIEKL